ncbi:hypothetical protein G4D63_10895 [Bacillus mesophilus]|uniref:Family 2 glycosyl transferase n=1 Tax=Bacillus mesophilus TaxID=1808955 RepID=A0A6M0Q7A1_9BACI|nr:hypothetical protein [Bacillus mesophilus]
MIYFLVMFGIIAAITSPFWSWYLKPEAELNVLIVDKTVPDFTYREHKGLTWLLNQNKYVQADQTVYDYTTDYVGFHPKENQEFEIKDLPEDLSGYDLLYIADGYGVYEEEFYGTNQQGVRSESLYGGMTTEEVASIKDAVTKNGTPLLVEFNTFANPTKPSVREEFYELLNLEWSGWIGRYFLDLSDEEVPVWVKSNYQNQNDRAWDFTGSGLVFADENDQIVVIDQHGLKEGGVLFNYTEKGHEQLSGKGEEAYNYWFDVVTAFNEEEILATYTLPVNEEGKKQLQQYNLPMSFPAIIHQDSLIETYYFAGDYADQEEVPDLYKTSGLKKWREYFSPRTEGSTLPFYWRVYVPMMDGIFKDLMNEPEEQVPKKVLDIHTVDGVSMIGKTNETYLEVYRDGAWEDLLIKGVNIGMGKPGTFPGEAAISKREYARWFQQIGEMNANSIRVYTIHPPGFYEALFEYNQTAKEPIYLFHGVWLNEDVFKTKDAYLPSTIQEFKDEIASTVDLIHGNATLPERPGHASGSYRYNLSPYVLGYILGVEWDPEFVVGTNEKNANKQDFSGTYIYTEEANPFEVWLAEMVDYTVAYEVENYNWQHPMSFTNWVTTDLLDHPSEVDLAEDMVSINPNVMHSTNQFTSGLFASYHIYPYYPEFLNLEKDYVNYIDHRGEKNNYAGYLHDMKQAHHMPLVVAEFGVPASRGIAHENVHGKDQGHHSEQEQGQIIGGLYEDIVHEDLAGGMVFIWQDEWFKRTWNTMKYDNPNRRPFWSNIQTSEQNYGLLSFDPSDQIKVDGDAEDWDDTAVKIYESDDDSHIQQVLMNHDERYVYVRIDYNQPIDWEKDRSYVLFNTIPNQGQTVIPNVKGKQATGIDFVLELSGKDTSKLVIDSYYDTFYHEFAVNSDMLAEEPSIQLKDNGQYFPIRLILNRETLQVQEDGSRKVVPIVYTETGQLTFGNANPNAEDYDSLSDVSISKDQKVVEVRIPWMMLNFKDPSQHEVIGDLSTAITEDIPSEFIEGIRVGVVHANEENEILQTFPSVLTNETEYLMYQWEKWNEPSYQERLKKSYYILKDVFERH